MHTVAPSRMVAPMPTRALSSTVAAWMMAPCPADRRTSSKIYFLWTHILYMQLIHHDKAYHDEGDKPDKLQVKLLRLPMNRMRPFIPLLHHKFNLLSKHHNGLHTERELVS